MSNDTADFSSDNFDWLAYLRHRPPYPAKLYDTIYSWHAAHSDNWSLACDLGCGIGNVATELASRFDSVEASDSSGTYVERAKAYVATVPSAKNKVTFAVRKGEDAIEGHGGKVDMITMAEAIQYTNVTKTISSAAEALQSGGTMAVWIYGTLPFASQAPSERVRKILAEIYRKWRAATKVPIGIKPVAPTMASRLDVLEFAPEQWSDVKRIYWSAGHFGSGWEIEDVDWETKIGKDDQIDSRPSDHLMTVDADLEWIRGYYRSLYPDIDMSTVCEDEYKQLETELAGRKVELCWTTTLVLATKR